MAVAVKVVSACPWNRGILSPSADSRADETYFQTMTFSPGRYLALPMPTLQSTLTAFSGVGILITTLFALSLGGKLALTWMVYSTSDLESSVTSGWMRKGRLMLDVERYLSPLSARVRAPGGRTA